MFGLWDLGSEHAQPPVCRSDYWSFAWSLAPSVGDNFGHVSRDIHSSITIMGDVGNKGNLF